MRRRASSCGSPSACTARATDLGRAPLGEQALDLGSPLARELIRRQHVREAIAIAQIALGKEPDRDSVLGAAHDLDPVAGPQLALLHDAQVGPGPPRPGELPHEPLRPHPETELEAGKPWLRDLDQRGPGPPALADQRLV